jgi:hypothetical protein
VVGSVWAVGAAARRSAAIQTATDQLNLTVNNIRGLYASQPDIRVNNTQAVVNGANCGTADFLSRLACLGAFPVDMMPNGLGTAPRHTLNNGAVAVLPRDRNLNVPAAGAVDFGVQFLGLPPELCTEMVIRTSVPDQLLGLRAVVFVDAGGGALNTYAMLGGTPDWSLGGTRPALPVTPPQAVVECQAANGIEWIFSLR